MQILLWIPEIVSTWISRAEEINHLTDNFVEIEMATDSRFVEELQGCNDGSPAAVFVPYYMEYAYEEVNWI